MAMFKMFVSIVLVLIATQVLAEQKTWRWENYEVIGYEKLSRADVLQNLPINIGDEYVEDQQLWASWCSELKHKLALPYTYCSAIRFIDFKAYFVIDIVEKGQERRIQFRPNPTQDIELADAEVREVYTKLYDRLWSLFNRGIPVKEMAEKGYLDFDDPEMHDLVVTLIKLVPPHRQNILEVLRGSRDSQKRADAANLLNWLLGPERNIEIIYKYLDDPNFVVRNNVSRFMLHYFTFVKNNWVRKRVIRSLAVQLSRPSHMDRNKAVMGLLEIARVFPEDCKTIRRYAFDWIAKVANQSILSNVKDPAVTLLELIDQKTGSRPASR